MPSVREISLTGSNPGSPPKYDEMEISIFGPGYGESVLVHLGNNEWMIVDSCINSSSKKSAPLEYLHGIGVDSSTAVKLIVASHWHDDHIRGLGSVVRSCASADFVCSAALRPEEFLTLVKAFGKRSMMTSSSGVEEFHQIIEVLRERKGQLRAESVGPHWAVADRLLWQRSSTGLGQTLQAKVYALSPSDAALTLSFHQIADLLPKKSTTKRRIVAQTPNHAAVVLWVEVGEASVLLGSDLEETTNPGTGWSVIVDSGSRPNGKASVLKVPHHGSVSADQPRVWNEMLEAEPITVLSPFIKGKVILPSEGDVKRIINRTTNAYATDSMRIKRTKRPQIVLKAIGETVRRIRQVHGSWGYVRLRTNALAPKNSEWNIELFGDALHLRKMYAA